MEKKMNRSEFFKKGAVITAGVSAVAFGGGFLFANDAAAGKDAAIEGSLTSSWPWPYPATGIDAETARKRAHDAFWSGKGCSYACFEAVVAGLRDTIGAPFTELPTELMIYGAGGGVGWGATCGTINGCAGAISLVSTKAVSDVLVNELFGWYTQTNFPTDASNALAISHGYLHNDYAMDLGKSSSGSPLCHASVTRWCNANSFGVNSNERKERCARLCGDTAFKTVEILNAQYAGTFAAQYIPASIIASCNSCHGAGSMQDNVNSKMVCSTCHGSDTFPHTTTGIKNIPAVDFSVNQNYPNPFTDRTTIEFSLEESENVMLEIYNLNGKHINTLINNVHYAPGNHTVVWDGTVQNGQKADAGLYIFNFRTAGGVKTVSMIKL